MPPLSVENKNLLVALAEGAKKSFENAEQLWYEAITLHQSGSRSRALFLHQISLEECGKIEMLGGWATSILMGHDVDMAKVTAALVRHQSKNNANAYSLEPSLEEKAARDSGDWKGAMRAFGETKRQFHQSSNAAKNAALYVDCRDGKFISPSEQITEEMTLEFRERNAQFLTDTDPRVRMLERWVKQPEQASSDLSEFETRMKELRTESPDDPMTALKTVMAEMLTKARAKKV